jgi:hypothetical protein
MEKVALGKKTIMRIVRLAARVQALHLSHGPAGAFAL